MNVSKIHRVAIESFSKTSGIPVDTLVALAVTALGAHLLQHGTLTAPVRLSPPGPCHTCRQHGC